MISTAAFADEDINEFFTKSFETCDLNKTANSEAIENSSVNMVGPKPQIDTPKCNTVLTPLELYELWTKNNPNMTKDNLDLTNLNPKLNEKEKDWFSKFFVVYMAKKQAEAKLNQATTKNSETEINLFTLERTVWDACIKALKNSPGKMISDYTECAKLEEKINSDQAQMMKDDPTQEKLIKGIFAGGEEKFLKKKNQSKHSDSGSSTVTESISSGNSQTEILNLKPKVLNSTITIGSTEHIQSSSNIPTNDSGLVGPTEKNTQPVTSENKPNSSAAEKIKPIECEEKLSSEVAALLSDKSKNIIGLQFELTTLKMASLSVSEGEKTFEGLIKKKSKDLKAIDDGSIDKMNQLYKKHGLAEDAKKISEALKLKATDSNYYNKQKRFFNNDSSAFLMAYQQINPSSPIKESDISVLWFMDKVSDKAQKQNKEYSSAHNRTNLSTRIAQYTGAIDPKKTLDKTKLDEMVKKQKDKIDHEFLAMIENFKKNNADCFNELFGGAPEDSECNLNKVEDVFGNLLAVNSKISSTDLVDLDGKLSGKINQASFSIARYVDSAVIPAVKENDKAVEVIPAVAQKVDPTITTKEEVKKEVKEEAQEETEDQNDISKLE